MPGGPVFRVVKPLAAEEEAGGTPTDSDARALRNRRRQQRRQRRQRQRLRRRRMREQLGWPRYDEQKRAGRGVGEESRRKQTTGRGEQGHAQSPPSIEFSSGSSSSTPSSDFSVALLEREQECKYGWGNFRPYCLQWCTDPCMVLVTLCFCVFAQNFGIDGIFPVSIRHIQSQFYLTSEDVGVIRMMFDIGDLIMIFPVLYFGAQSANRPVWISIGSFLSGIGAFLFCFPQFLVGVYEPERAASFCPANGTAKNLTAALSAHCDKHSAGLKYVFMGAMLLYGMGATPIYTMGLTYLDENVTHRRSSVFSGLFLLFRFVGLAAGFFSAGQLIRLYGELDSMLPRLNGGVDDSTYDAWWIGMLITTGFNWATAVVASGLPHRLPGALVAEIAEMKKLVSRSLRRHRHRRRYLDQLADSPSTMRQSATSTTVFSALSPDTTVSLTNLWLVIRRCLAVLRLAPYVGLVMDNCALSFMTATFIIYLPKYLQKALNLPIASSANFAALMAVIAMVGILAGMFLQHTFDLQVSGNIRLALVAALGSLIFSSSFLIKCQKNPIGGVMQVYPLYNSSEHPGDLNASCNQHCGCTTDVFEPVCYKKGNKEKMTIFSGCFAGCRNYSENRDKLSDCDCIPPESPAESAEQRLTDTTIGVGGGSVPIGYCKEICPPEKAYAFMVGLAWLTFCMFVRVNAVKQSMLRCVQFSDRILSLAMAMAFEKVFGDIPAPPIYGAIVQDACVAWSKHCGRASCVWTDGKQLALSTIVCTYLVTFVSVIGLTMAICTHKPPNETATTTTSAESADDDHDYGGEGGRRRRAGGRMTGESVSEWEDERD